MLKNQRGFGLVDILVFGGILSGAIVGLMELQSQKTRGLRATRVSLARDQITNILSNYAGNWKALRASAAYASPHPNSQGNQVLNYCLNGVTVNPPPACAPNCCKSTTAAVPQPFNLIDPVDPAGTRVLAGTDAEATYGFATVRSPARFDLFGEPCAAAGPDCPIEAVTSFVGDCGGAAQCPRVSNLTINLTIRQATDAAGNPVSTGDGPPIQTTTKTIRLR